MKWVLRGLLAFAVLIVVVLAGGVLWLRTGLPDYDTTLRIEGLRAPVQVIRDENAVPHIFAGNEADAYFALGYVHAQDRMFQMDLRRRAGAGRLAELMGDRVIGFDRLTRTLGVYRLAQAAYDRAPDGLRTALDAYAAGVNTWLETRGGALPPEYAILRTEPEPWTPADSLVWAELIALQLAGNWRQEIERARLADALGADALDDLFLDAVGTAPATLAAGALDRAALDSLWASLPDLGPSTASNEWVVGGDRTASGLPILANDPHLRLSTPALWYLARIETPETTLVGATVAGVPAMVIGHNGHIAWGLTTTGGDVQDLFVERIDPDDPNRYLTPEGSRPFETRTETIAVRGGEPVELTIRETRHGPVISDLDEDFSAVAGPDAVVALAFTALDPEDRTAEALWRLNQATDWQSFLDAVRLWGAPQQNLVYADTEGTFGFVTPGHVPVRRAGDGLSPVPGWTGEYGWTGTIPFDDLPQVRDPETDVLVNANNAPVGPDYPYLIAHDYDEPYRARRIEQMLEGASDHDIDDSVAVALDTVSLAAADLLPLMLEARAEDARAADALAMLRRWDYRMDRERPEPLVFAAWLKELNRALYADELGDLFEDYWGLRPSVVRRMLTERPGWCDDVRTDGVEESCADMLQRSLRAAIAELTEAHGEDVQDWRWGEAHVAPLGHEIFGFIPVLDRLFGLAIETDGGPYTVNRGAFWSLGSDRPFRHQHGAGLRVFHDMADLTRSRFVIATGQSGNVLSPHYGDFTERWRDGEHVTLAGSPADLAERGLGTLTLRPAEE